MRPTKMDIRNATDHDGIELVDEWEHEGLTCRLHLYTGSHYTGYVQVPFAARDMGTDEFWYEHRITAHGGLTYGVDDAGFVGIDFHHSQDICMDDRGNPIDENCYALGAQYEWGLTGFPRYWGISECTIELNRLAEQLAELEQFEWVRDE